MKKLYSKPMLYIESFQLMEHIAGNCIVNDGFAGANHRDSTHCNYSDGNLLLFYSESNNCDMAVFSGFSTEEISKMLSDGSVAELKIGCYNNFLITTKLFAS